MALTRLAINRPLTMLMIILGLVVMGYQALTLLQVDRFPKVDLPVVSIVTVFPGASPEDVEDLIIEPIEDAVAGISGIDEVISRANESVGLVIVQFQEGVEGDQAAIDIERQVAVVRGQLPDEAHDPSIIKADVDAIPIMQIVLKGPQSQEALFELAEDHIKPRLQAVLGVASVGISGGREREIQINAAPPQLAAYGLPLESIQRALIANNLTFPVGSIETDRKKTAVRSIGEFASLKEIEDVVVAGGPSPGGGGSRSAMPGQDTGGWVYLRNVAAVQADLKDREQILRYNGLETVSISVIKTSDSNAVEVADNIRTIVDEINRDLPSGADMLIVIDTSKFTRETVAAVMEDLTLAVLITGVVMLIFLHTIRSTFIVVLAIPTSIISTFLVMWVLGFSLNQLTLLALTLSIGILVDDSIVVLENIERHLKMKKKPPQAALDGRSEIGLAAITITLVDVVVYLPVAFTSGLIGQFFYSYGITIATAVLFSLFVSFTLTPMLAALWLRDESEPEEPPYGLRKFSAMLVRPILWLWDGFTYWWERGFTWLTVFYAATLRFTLKNFFTQSLTVLIAVAALAGGIYMVISGIVASEIIPEVDDGQFTIDIEMPPDTSLFATDRVARQVEQIVLAEVPEATAILTNVGGGDGNIFISGTASANSATVTVRLVDKAARERSTIHIVDALRPLVKKIPEASISVQLTSSIGGPPGGDIQVRIFGPDPDQLIDLANQVETVMKTVPGVVDIRNTDAARAAETRIMVDRDRALDLGLSPAQIAGTLRMALAGSEAGQYKPEGDIDIDMTLRVSEEARHNLNQLLQIPLGYRQRQPVTLNQVAAVEQSLAPARITRANRQRVLTVSSGVEGRGSADVADDVEAAIQAQIEFPPNYGFEFAGLTEQQREAFAQLGEALLLAILLIYMLLVALYQSWLHPLAIMFSLPVALVGAFGGLWLTSNSLNIISILGIILLTGVVTKNAILLVDFTNVLRREQGYERKAALVEAGRLRLRPILMTSIVLIFALLPLLFGAGAGSEIRAPLAAVVVGGNITSTLLTLILVPVVYNFFDGGGSWVSATVSKILGTAKRAKGQIPPTPTPQPGSAISTNPSAPSSNPDLVQS